MGAASSQEQAFNVVDLDTWTLKHVKLVEAKYVRENLDFGITRPDFKALLDAAGGNDAKREEFGKDVWDIIDPNNAGMIATLEAICYFCIGCSATLEDKIDFIFNVFDFNNGGDISYDEMVILMSSVLTAMVKYDSGYRGTVAKSPTDEEMEKITDEAFLDADANANGTIHKSEFREWVTKQLSEDNLEVTCADILKKFGLLEDGGAAGDIEVECENAGAGDQSAGNSSAYLSVEVKGIGQVSGEYNKDKRMFTFTTNGGLSCTSTDEGFVQDKYIFKLANMKAKRLAILTTKASRNKKRESTQALVVSDQWADQDDLADYMQLIVLSLSNQERLLRERKEQLEERIADLE